MTTETVTKLVNDYADAFTAQDAVRVAGFYTLPTTIVDASNSVTFDDRGALEENIERLLGSYRALGFERAEARDMAHEQITSDASQVDIAWRLHTSGAPIDFRTRYWLVDRDDQLAIAAVLAYSEQDATGA